MLVDESGLTGAGEMSYKRSSGAVVDLEVFDLEVFDLDVQCPAGDDRLTVTASGRDLLHVGSSGRHRANGPPRLSNGGRLVSALLLTVALHAAVAERSLTHAATPPATSAPVVTPVNVPATTTRSPLRLDTQWAHHLEQTCWAGG